MKRIKQKNNRILLILIVGLMSINANATHLMGGGISYRNIKPGVFKVTTNIFRDCRGISLNGNIRFEVFCANQSNIRVVDSAKRISIHNVTFRCSKDTLKPCFPLNTHGKLKGAEKHTYEFIIDFNKAPYNKFVTNNCCEIIISMKRCCRNSAITTGIQGVYFTNAMLNICNFNLKTEKQSSPTNTTTSVVKAICNSPFIYNNGILDTSDFDSLAYKMVSPLSDWKKPISYTSPLSYNMPITPYCPNGLNNCPPKPNNRVGGRFAPIGFHLNKETGDLTFLPTKCNETTVICVKVEEWRRKNGTMKMVGYVRKEIQISVEKGIRNNPPTITGPFKNMVCEGDVIKFNISAKDIPFRPGQKVGDTVQITWNRGIKKGTFVIKNKKAKDKVAVFTWKTKIGDASDAPYFFTVTAKDDNCPIRAIQTRTFSIKVNKKATSVRSYIPIIGSKVIVNSNISSNFRGTPTYKWELKDSLLRSFSPIITSTKKMDSLKLTYDGLYFVVHTINNPQNCPTTYTDTFTYNKKSVSIMKVKTSPLIFYPNPILKDGILTIRLNNQNEKISIFDLKGAKISLKTNRLGNKIEMKGFKSKGIFIIERKAGNTATYYKLIVN